MMSEHDKALCDWAWALPPQEWGKINENAADTPEGKEELHQVQDKVLCVRNNIERMISETITQTIKL